MSAVQEKGGKGRKTAAIRKKSASYIHSARISPQAYTAVTALPSDKNTVNRFTISLNNLHASELTPVMYRMRALNSLKPGLLGGQARDTLQSLWLCYKWHREYCSSEQSNSLFCVSLAAHYVSLQTKDLTRHLCTALQEQRLQCWNNLAKEHHWNRQPLMLYKNISVIHIYILYPMVWSEICAECLLRQKKKKRKSQTLLVITADHDEHKILLRAGNHIRHNAQGLRWETLRVYGRSVVLTYFRKTYRSRLFWYVPSVCRSECV